MTVQDDMSAREQIREVLRGALEFPPDQRRRFVKEHLPEGEVREDALSLMEEVDDLGDFLEGSGVFATPRKFEPTLPKQIGEYAVERILGWGAMGVVYLARQKAPMRRVALKVLRLDVGAPTAARRFEREGEVLAKLSHRGIASVFEAGVADLGTGAQPFLAMEWVDGVSIIRYADEHHLDDRGRVELIEKVARAIAHAHGHGVLHRDLKPDNVLVRPDGSPVVVDFGVALTRDEDSEQLTLTATGQVIGTLAYMPPEQARGAELDARADQFALGAILHELLTGDLPFDVRGRLPHEALRIIADADGAMATQHQASLGAELCAILATSLAPEPVRRYASVEAFADDLERWLRGIPVLARRPSRLVNLTRFVQRNRGLSSLVAVGLLLLGGGLAWGTASLMNLRQEEKVSLVFADRRLLSSLEAEADTLWPSQGATLPAIESWLARAEELVAHLPRQREAVAYLEGQGRVVAGAGAELDTTWLIVEGRDLIQRVEHFQSKRVPVMRERARVAREMPDRTLIKVASEWEAARARVLLDERFDDFHLVPQEGLIPLGPDPDSGLEEFVLWCSGEQPKRNAESGALEYGGQDGLVFVLIPGGDVWVGVQRMKPEGIHHDPAALTPPLERSNEGPPCPLRLDPYLISKYEMTQAQWVRLAGVNPSDHEMGATFEGRLIGPKNPVESLSQETCLKHLAHWGITLPTEAQWETAARGGSSGVFMIGDDLQSLDGYVNWRSSSPELTKALGICNDGHYSHMPVDTLLPNGYGLHHVIGNVWEFCLDTYKVRYHFLEHRDGDGLVVCQPDGDVSRRGHSCAVHPTSARLGVRGDRRFDGRDAVTGLRPARALHGLQPSPSPSTTPETED